MNFSENITFCLTTVVSCLIIFISFIRFWRKRNLPPGPTPLPILGNLLQLSKGDLVTSLLKLGEKYGEVFIVYLGTRPVVVVTGYKAVKEVYVDRGDDFLARGDIACFDFIYKSHGFAFTSNMKRWWELRKFAVSTMRNFGMGKRTIENRIQEEALCLVTEFKKTKESLVEPRNYLSKATCNVIFAIVFGNRHDYEDAELLNVLSLIHAVFSITSSQWGLLYEMFPWAMRYIPGRHQKIFISLKELIQFVEKKVAINKQNLDENNPRSFVDAFLIKMEKEITNPKTEFHMTNLLCSTLQILFGAVETTSTALTYSLLLMMKHPNILEKVQKEIDQVIGRDRCPKMEDQSQMPFTDAVIHEILRFSDVLPFGGPRKTTKDITYRGYSIPKDTNVYVMLTSVLKDPTHFPYPKEFNPQNFRDENEEFKKNDAFIPLATAGTELSSSKESSEERSVSTMNFSENITLLLAAVVSSLIVIISFMQFWRKGNLPPGPTPLPILGNLLQLSKADIVTSLLKLSEKYGEVFTVYLGSRPVVVVTGYKAVKEVYVDRGEDFLARGDIACFDFVYKNYGVAFTSNMERWRELRRFSVSTMRDFGMGKKTIEDRVQEEALCLVTEFKKTKESLVEPRHCLSKATFNVIFAIMFGDRHHYEDAELLNVLILMYDVFSITSSPWGQMFEMFPWAMQYIPGKHQKIFASIKKLLQFVQKRVEISQKCLDENNLRGYADVFLIKMEKEITNPKTEFNMTNLVYSIVHIFCGAVETTGTTLTYSLLLLMKYPNILEKVHKEIDQVIGRDRCPKIQDQSQMPFTDAVIHEILRFIDLLPFGVPRKTTADITYRGYSIPKDTNVYPMLTSVLKDPTHFPYAKEFNPQNFLDENGDLKRNDAFIPLAIGKRKCLGESLARVEIFIILITILQNFNLKSPVPPEDLDISPEISGLGNLPKQFKLSFIPR